MDLRTIFFPLSMDAGCRVNCLLLGARGGFSIERNVDVVVFVQLDCVYVNFSSAFHDDTKTNYKQFSASKL